MRNCCSIPGKDKRFLLFSEMFRAALWHTQPFVPWVPGLLSPRLSSSSVMLTTHLHLVLKLRMSGAIPPFTHMPSWYAEGKLYLGESRKDGLKVNMCKFSCQHKGVYWYGSTVQYT